uniref:Uncharacterized protein n=1 Tax=Cacopsylla melanoneura TaxID=428564 RepID=A0A8D9EUM6_9HEMI
MNDPTHFEFCWNSLATNGELIQIGVDENNSFGMHRFMNNQSVFSVNSRVILNQDETVKKHMYNFVNDAIQSGVIQPIAARIIEHDIGNTDRAIREHDPEIGVIQPIAGRIDRNVRAKREHIPEIREDIPEIVPAHNQQRSSLKDTVGYVYEVIPINTGETSLRSTWDENNNLDLNNNEDSSCSSDSTLPQSLESHLPLLDAHDLPPNHLKNLNTKMSKIQTAQTPISIEQIDAHLPIDHLKKLHREISKIQKPSFVEQSSLSLKKDLVYNLLPVFYIPGLSKMSLKKLIAKMINPSFLGHIPVGWTMEDIVVHLYKSLIQIQENL